MGGASAERSCDASAATVFVVGLVAGTVCIISSKALFELSAHGSDGELQHFQPPVFETFIMFFGMVFALPLYFAMEGVKRLRAHGNPEAQAKLAAEPEVTLKMVLSLGIPAVFDLSSVLLLMAGLVHIPASIWMLLRGGCIVFVALMKQFVLGSSLTVTNWVGVATITLAVVLVGLSTMVGDDAPPPTSDDDSAPADDSGSALLGIMLTIGGTFMQSLQYAYEEKVLSGDNPAPPWLLIGMEGVFGSMLTVLLVYPLAGFVPGNDHGTFEDLENTLAMLSDNPALISLSAVFCASVFMLNSFSVLVTFMLSSVWHAILDNFRPITIWAVQLALFHLTDGAHGEEWTRGSYLQLIGLAVMLLGTAIYNGTVGLPGLPGADLLATGDPKSSPALARSPLLTRNAEPGAEFGNGSPYAPRAQIDLGSGDEVLARGAGKGQLTERLVVNVKK